MADEKIKISALAQGTPQENDIIPYVDLATNTTKKALKSELKGIQGDAATVDAGTTTTLAAGESATVTNIGTTAAAIFNFAIPQGIQGLTGADGACVESVAFVGNDMVFTLDDNSTVTLTNAKTDLKGDTGLTGAKITSASFVGDDLVFVLDDTSTVTVTGAKTDLKGDTGNPGADGDAATITVGTVTTVANNVPASVTNSGTSAAAIFDFEIPKGLDGTGSGDITGSGVANELAYFTAEKTIDNLPVATYPSLTEVSYVKGVTSSIQTQLGDKEATANKENTTLDTSTTKYPTNRLVKEYADGKVEDSITDGHTTIAPSGNAVFDALAGKQATMTKATGSDIDTGTDDAKFVTTKALAESNLPLHTATWSLVESDKEVAIGTALGGDWRIPGNRAIKIKKVGAYVDIAGTTNATTIDINEAGTSILSTKITIDSGSKSSVGATTPPVISDTNIAADAILTFDVDGVSTTKPKGLKVYIEFTY